jgi:hypothetical protein
MTPRTLILAGLCSISMVASCAEGGGATIPLDAGSATGTLGCGDGVVDTTTEVCECPVGSTADTCVAMEKTCAEFMPGTTGSVLCVRTTCMYDMTMCINPGTAGTSGGSGAGG